MTTSEAHEVAATSTVRPERARPAVADRYVTSPRQDLVTVVLGAVMIGGLLSDAWAHTNIIDTIESFFTPWHAALYGGFAGTAAWTFWLAYSRRPVTPRWWRDGWPAGYLVGAVGAVGFMVGGFLDMVWHTIFGIEASLDIAFSPSHILLSLSGTLLLTSPLRSWWATGERGLRSVTGVLSLALGTVMASILLTTFSAFTSTAPTRSYEQITGSLSNVAATLGMADYLITTLVLAVPLLMVHRRRPAPGTATALVAILALFACTMYALPATQTAAAAGAIAGAILADLALHRLDASRGRDALLRLPIAGAVFAALVWAGHLLGMHLSAGIGWSVELWTGTIVITALLAAVLGGLAERPAPGLPARR